MPVSLIYFMPGLQNFGNSILCGKLVCFLQQVDHTYLSKDLSSAELQQRHGGERHEDAQGDRGDQAGNFSNRHGRYCSRPG